MNALLEQLDEHIRKVVAQTLSAHGGGGDERHADAALPVTADALDEVTRKVVREQVVIAHKSYLTRKEAAKYLGVSERSIGEWAARAPEHNPFPEASAGGEPRTKRTAIDEWAERENMRRKLKAVG